MNRTSALPIAFLLASLALPAQDASKHQKPLNFVIPAPLSFACPVVMDARHEDGLHRRVLVNGAAAQETPGLRFVLTLINPQSTRIVKAKVTVHGTNGKWQLFKADTAQTGSAEASKTLELEFTSPGDEKNVSANLMLPGFTSVTSIELDSLTYANGSSWKFAGRGSCQVAPNPFMLVDAQMAH